MAAIGNEKKEVNKPLNSVRGPQAFDCMYTSCTLTRICTVL